MEEATELRDAEKAKNQQVIKEAQEAQKAVEAATKVLKDFYDKAAQATALAQTALVQTGSSKQPVASLLGRGVKLGSEEW